MKRWAIGCCIALVIPAAAQDPLSARDQRIAAHYAAERYAEALSAIDEQVEAVRGTTWQDSLARYAYRYGSATTKLQQAEAGLEAFERFRGRVAPLLQGAEPRLRLVQAGGDLSADLGRINNALHYDSLALQLVMQHPELPGALRGRVYHRLGADLQAAWQMQAAIGAFERAIAIYEATEPIPLVQLASSYNALGACHWNAGNDAAAEKAYRSARGLLDGTADPEGLDRLAGVFGNLGIMYQSRGDLDQAKRHYQQSQALVQRLLAAAKEPRDRDRLLVTRSRGYLNLATVYFNLGDHGRSRQLLGLAWADRSAVLQADDPRLLTLKEAMADQEFMVGDPALAERYFREVLVGAERSSGKGTALYFRSAAKLAEAIGEAGRYEAADTLFQEVMAGAKNNPAITPKQYGEACSRWSRILMVKGRYAEAMAVLDRAQEAYGSIYAPDHYAVVRTLLLKADAAWKEKDHPTALRLADQALAAMAPRIRAIRNGDGPLLFQEPQLLHDAVLYKVAAERAMAVPGRGHEEWLADVELVVDGMERNRVAMSDDASKLGVMGTQHLLTELGLDVAYEHYVKDPSGSAVERFLDLDEADRTVLLRDRLNGFVGVRFGDVPDSVLAEEQRLLAALDVDTDDPAALQGLHTSEEAFQTFLQRIAREHPRYHALRYGRIKLSLTEVRARLLGPQRDLLVYAFGMDHLYAAVVTGSEAHLIKLSRQGIEQRIQRLQRAIEERSMEAYVQEAHALYAQIWAPLAPYLKNPELLIVPDGPLHALNFETLVERPVKAGALKEHLLLRRHAIAYLLSVGTALQFAKLDRTPGHGVLALAPGFTDDVKQHYRAQVADTNLLDRDYLRYVRQPFAVDAVERIPGAMSAQVRVGVAATEQDFRKEAERYGVLHFGTHAIMDPKAPLYSRLVLSKNGSGLEADADGYLHAYEIYALQLHAELAVLTACETGAGRVDHGEGVRSLGHGFAYAGCPSLVLSLWKIDERTSADVITRFYRNLGAGMPKHVALQQAKLAYLDAITTDELAQPYYWGGLVLVGDVAPVQRSFRQRYGWWIAGALVLCALIAGSYARRRRTH